MDSLISSILVVHSDALQRIKQHAGAHLVRRIKRDGLQRRVTTIAGIEPVRRTWSYCSTSSGAATSTGSPGARTSLTASYRSSW